MILARKFKEHRVGGAVGATLTALLGLWLLVFDVGQGLRDLSFDLPFALRPTLRPEEVVMVYMDEESHTMLGQHYEAPWDRRVHAQLLERLKAYGSRAVAMDILFDQTNVPNATADAALVEAARVHGNVVVSARFSQRVHEGGAITWNPELPFPQLRGVAPWGVAEAADGIEIIRQHFQPRQEQPDVRSLAWRVAELTHPDRLGDPHQARWLNYYGPPRTIRWTSYLQVLSNTVPAATISNKVVFVGALINTPYSGGKFSGGKGVDEFWTPYSRWSGTKSPGVEINATAYLNLVQRDWLRRLSPVQELLAILLSAVVFGFGLNLLRPLTAAAAGAAAIGLIYLTACLLTSQWHVWFAWAIVSFVQVPCAAVCTALFHTQKIYLEKTRLEERLASATPAYPPPHAIPSPTPTPALLQQQLRERLHTPLPPIDGSQAPTTVGSSDTPQIPDHTLLRQVGSGAYGEVWLGTSVLGAFRAIKVVYRKNFLDDRPYDREFHGIERFDPISRSHPGLLHIFHVGRNNEAGYFYYLMELADDCQTGQRFNPETYEPRTLRQEIHKHVRLPVEQCLQLALTLTDSLGHLHQLGLIHRDIKPSNIIFVEGKPKLADIGLVTEVGEGSTIVGTEGFMPDEGPGLPAADVYSLGIVLYHALTGLTSNRFPELPTELGPVVQSPQFHALNRIILKACETDAKKRYASAREMHTDLERLVNKNADLPALFK